MGDPFVLVSLSAAGLRSRSLTSLGVSPCGFESRHQHPRLEETIDSAEATDDVVTYVRGLRVASFATPSKAGEHQGLRLSACTSASSRSRSTSFTIAHVSRWQ